MNHNSLTFENQCRLNDENAKCDEQVDRKSVKKQVIKFGVRRPLRQLNENLGSDCAPLDLSFPKTSKFSKESYPEKEKSLPSSSPSKLVSLLVVENTDKIVRDETLSASADTSRVFTEYSPLFS